MSVIIDLSISIENDVPADPEGFGPKIQYVKHKDQASLDAFAHSLHGITFDSFPDGEVSAYEHVTLSTHSGTHLDAPWHYHSTMNNGKDKSWTIDQVPLDWCFCSGVKLDFRHFEDGYVVTAKDIQDELQRINHKLKPMEIVLVNTSAGSCYGQNDYVNKGCGMGREATLFLLDQGIRITGTDAWSWDAPFVYTDKRYQRTKNPKILWEGHKAGRENCYCHLEKLHNLEQLTSSGFKICCFPVKIKAASAGWTRAVAIMPEKQINKFIGTWELQSWTVVHNGEVNYPYGKKPTGYINYFANGLVTVVIMRDVADISKIFSNDNFFDASDKDKVESFNSYLSYWGEFTIDEDAKVVTHKLKGCWYPHMIGTEQKRCFEFKDDLLTLSSQANSGKHALVWKKINNQ